MDFEKPVQAPTLEELEELLKYYSLEETQAIYDQHAKDIEKQKEKIYTGIQREIINGKAELLSARVKQFFLDNLKEEDFELASKLNKQ